MLQVLPTNFNGSHRPPFAGTPPALAIRLVPPRAAASQILSEMHGLSGVTRRSGVAGYLSKGYLGE